MVLRGLTYEFICLRLINNLSILSTSAKVVNISHGMYDILFKPRSQPKKVLKSELANERMNGICEQADRHRLK